MRTPVVVLIREEARQTSNPPEAHGAAGGEILR